MVQYYLKHITYLLLLTCSFNSFAADFTLKFSRTSPTSDPNNRTPIDSIRIETFKFYVTEIHLFFSNGKIFSDSSAHLVDLSEILSSKLKLNFNWTEAPDSILIHYGTDSITNSSGARGGDLDPTAGMYWTWQSGYVNYKVQGAASGRPFEYHLGGYRHPYITDRIRSYELEGYSAELVFDSGYFLGQAFGYPSRKMMSPGKQAFELSDIFVSSFNLVGK